MVVVRDSSKFRISYDISSFYETLYTHGQISTASASFPTILLFPCAATVNIAQLSHNSSLIIVNTLTPPDAELVTSCAISPDATTAIVATRSSFLASYLLPKKWILRSQEDTSVSASASTSAIIPKIVVTSDPNSVDLKSDMFQPRLLKHWKPFPNGVVVASTFESSSGLFAVGSADSAVRIFDAQSFNCTHIFQVASTGGGGTLVTNLSFHPDSNRMELYAACENGTIAKCDLVTNKITLLQNHTRAPTSCAYFGFRAANMVSAGRDKIISVWAGFSSKLEKTILTDEEIAALVILPSESSARSNSASGSGSTSASTPDSVIACAVDAAGSLRIWDIQKGTQIHVSKSRRPPINYDDDHDRELLGGGVSMLWCPSQDQTNGGHLIVTHTDQEIHIYKIDLARITSPHTVLSSLSLVSRNVGNLDEIYELRFLNQSHICVASNSNDLHIFDCSSKAWTLEHSLTGHTNTILSIDVSDTLVASASKDKTLRLWQYQNSAFHLLGVADGHTDAVGALALSHIRKNDIATAFLVSVAADRTLKLWKIPKQSDSSNRKQKKSHLLEAKWTVLAHDKDINCVQVSPDNKLVATGSQDKSIKLWSTDSGALIHSLRSHRRGVWSLSFSSVDKILASASGDRTIKLWSVAQGVCLRTIEGHSAVVLKIVFMTSGTQLCSAAADGILKFWNAKTGDCLTTLDAHPDKIWSLAIKGDGDFIASGGADATIKIWKDTTKEKLREAAAQADKEAGMRQSLDDALYDKNWVQAFDKAMLLDHPRQIRDVLEKLLRSGGQKTLEKTVGEFLKSNNVAYLKRLLELCRDWNAFGGIGNGASVLALRVLKAIFLIYPVNDLTEKIGSKDGKDLVEALIAHVNRHYTRINRMKNWSFFLDYNLEVMNAIEPPDENGAEKKKKRQKASI